MDRIKKSYINMPLKRALILTVVFSLILSFLLSMFVLMSSRSSYYKLVAVNPQSVAVHLHDLLTILAAAICSAVPVAVGIYIFYKCKLSVPLQCLMDGTEQIALNNLDFTMQYKSRDELGVLCGSFDNMKDELQQNFKKVWRMTEERRKLNAAFAHDLRTPLTVLRGYTDFLDEYIPFPGKSDEKLLATNRMMAQYIHRLEEYTEIMNTIQKLEDTPVKPQSVSMDDFMELLTDNVKLTAEEYKKEFSVVNKTGCSSIHADISIILRAFENIVRNAFRFAKSEVTICLFCRKDMLYIDVMDDGLGFSDRDLEQALNPFYTSEHSDTAHFGLGLSICKTLCENHGGSISLCNVENSGAKVEISLRIKK